MEQKISSNLVRFITTRVLISVLGTSENDYLQARPYGADTKGL